MRGPSLRRTLTLLALVTALYVPAPPAGAAEATPFDLGRAVAGAQTAGDHEAIATYYDREHATAQAQAATHQQMATAYRTIGGGKLRMEEHCRQLVHSYESAAAGYAALALAHRQLAQAAGQKTP